MAKKKKKAAKKKATRKKSSGGRRGDSPRTTLARQLVAANQDLKAIFESESEWRMELLQENEQLTRDTVDTEAEIKRLQDQQLQLGASLGALRNERDGVGSEVQELSRSNDSLQREHDKSDSQRDDLVDKVKGLKHSLGQLQKETTQLGKEAGKLEGDVERLEQLRKEYLAQVGKFRKQKSKLLDD